MSREVPAKLLSFLKTGVQDVEDGYEYASELNRILHSDECRHALTDKEIELLRDYADKVSRLGEITYHTEERIKDAEREFFGDRGILGFLGIKQAPQPKPVWPF